MRLELSNVHFDGLIRYKWDVLLRIVGDFALWVGDKLVYREVEFCLVEFAVALSVWLSVATDMGPDFIYTSMESETEGLIRFTRLGPGSWRVSAAGQGQPAEASLTTGELKDAALAYIRELRSSLQPTLDILEYIEDPKASETLREMLDS